MYSSKLATDCWEIAILEPNGSCEMVSLCGLPGSRGEAAEMADALTGWLHDGRWSGAFDRLPPDDQEDLRAMHRGLLARGVILSQTTVRVVPEGWPGRACGFDEDDEATPLEDVDVFYTVGESAKPDHLTEAEWLFGRG